MPFSQQAYCPLYSTFLKILCFSIEQANSPWIQLQQWHQEQLPHYTFEMYVNVSWGENEEKQVDI